MKYSFMKCMVVLGAAACSALLFAPTQPRARADEIPEKYRKAVDKGLEWLASKQNEKGFWGANGDNYPITMTALAGMALLMEGSTVKEGKYAAHLRKAVDWLIDKSNEGGNKDGLIGDTNLPQEAGRYMYGHGFATLFLASVYGDDLDKKKALRLKDILLRAVKYIGNAQSTQGGWFYTSKADGGDNDEGSVTITQMQALRACRNAGITVPKEILKKGIEYLQHSTTERGGVVYSLGRGGMKAPIGGERPALTAAAISCGFSAGEYKSDLCKKWLKYCQTNIPINGGVGRIGHDEYTHYYYAQALYILGEKGWENLFGPTPEQDRLTWTKYRDSMGDRLVQIQAQDGSFPSGGGFSVGTVYSTAVYLTILQLDKGVLPIYQR
jgi:squalene cyclase